MLKLHWVPRCLPNAYQGLCLTALLATQTLSFRVRLGNRFKRENKQDDANAESIILEDFQLKNTEGYIT
jgi:hypothetical protein